MKYKGRIFVILLAAYIVMALGINMVSAESSNMNYEYSYAVDGSADVVDSEISTESIDASKDGPISVTISTDKDSYGKNDKILVTLTVKNTSVNTVEDLVIDLELPKGYKLHGNQSLQLKYQSLAENKTVIEEYELIYNGTSEVIQSAVKYGTVVIIAIVLLDILAILIFGIVKLIKGPKKALSIILVVVLSMGSLPVFAASANDDIYKTASDSVTTNINVGGKELNMGATLSYSAAVSSSILYNFRTNQHCFWTGETSRITFSVNSRSNNASVALYSRHGGLVDYMHDDGLNGDEKSGDGIYTCVKSIGSDSTGSSEYFARTDDGISGSEILFFFDYIDDNDIEQMKATASTISGLDDKYTDDNGYVAESNIASALESVKNYAEELDDKGEVLDYDYNDFSCTITLNNGMTIAYTPKTETLDAGGNDVDMTVLTMQPYYDIYTDLGDLVAAPDTAAAEIAASFGNIAFTEETNYDTSEVTLELIKSLTANQIVLWHGHGGYSDSIRSYLCLGQPFQWSDPTVNRDYYLDYINGRILCGSSGNTIITSEFIEAYCGDLSGSFFYLGTCSSGKDDTLANALLDKGATAVVANDGTICSKYNTSMLYSVISLMTQINKTTANYYTLDEALRGSYELLGDDDLEWCDENGTVVDKTISARPIIFGGDDAINYRFRNTESCRAIGTVKAADNDTNPIHGAVVSVYTGDRLYDTTTSNENGDFSFTLPLGDYTLTVESNGYKALTANITLYSEGVAYIEPLILVCGSDNVYGFVAGTIINAFTGIGLDAVKLDVREGWGNTDGNIITSTISSSTGAYSLELPIGNYTITASKDNYITTSFNVYVPDGAAENQNCTISAKINGNQFRITLTWDDDPIDIDATVVATGNTEYFLYFDDAMVHENGTLIASLDVDDRDGYGPETVTMTTDNYSDYFFFVHKYEGTSALSDSNAQVRIYQGESLLAVYNVPTDQGDDDYWNVFAITNGKIIAGNTVTDEPDVMYIYN